MRTLLFAARRVLLCAVAAGAVACSKSEAPGASAPPSAKPKEAPVAVAEPKALASQPLRIAYSDWPGWVAWEIGLQKGYFDEEGVKVDFKWFEYAPSMEAFSAGKVDAVTMTNGDAMVTQSSGTKSVSILINDYSNGNDMVVAKAGVTKMKALRGKSIGVELGFVDHLLLLKALESAGLTEKDVKLVNVPTDQTAQLLKSGTVDAIAAWQPNSGLALREVPGSTAIFTSKDAPGLIYDVLSVSPKSLSERRDDWKKVVKVWLRIADFLKKPENSDEAAKIMAARVGLSADQYKPLMSGTFFLDGALNLKHFQKGDTLESVFHSSKTADEFQKSHGVYSASAYTEAMFDPSLLHEVLGATGGATDTKTLGAPSQEAHAQAGHPEPINERALEHAAATGVAP